MKIMAIALCGGKSSRMGRDKALLEINGKTLLSRTCQTALQIVDDVYVVARSQEQYQQAIAGFNEHTFLVVDQKAEGALIGFWQGLKAISTQSVPDWILLLACDLPNIQTEILQTWASQLANLPERAIAYLPSYLGDNLQKKWEPLCGFYRWQAQDLLTEFIDNGGRSFQKWLDHQEVVEILDVPLVMLFNCNTPDDFEFLDQKF